MESESQPPLSELQQSLNSVHKLQRSSWASVLLLITGGAFVVASFVYSITRLRPLERQIASAQKEFERLQDRSKELSRANDAAETKLKRTTAEVDKALARLEQIRKELPQPGRAAIEDAILNIHEATASLRTAEGVLSVPPQKRPPGPEYDRQACISDLFNDQASVRLRAYNDLMAYYSGDPDLVSNLLDYADQHSRNENGVYNTLVVLGQLSKGQLNPHTARIEKFATTAKQIGPKTNKRATDLLDYLESAD